MKLDNSTRTPNLFEQAPPDFVDWMRSEPTGLARKIFRTNYLYRSDSKLEAAPDALKNLDTHLAHLTATAFLLDDMLKLPDNIRFQYLIEGRADGKALQPTKDRLNALHTLTKELLTTVRTLNEDAKDHFCVFELASTAQDRRQPHVIANPRIKNDFSSFVERLNNVPLRQQYDQYSQDKLDMITGELKTIKQEIANVLSLDDTMGEHAAQCKAFCVDTLIPQLETAIKDVRQDYKNLPEQLEAATTTVGGRAVRSLIITRVATAAPTAPATEELKGRLHQLFPGKDGQTPS